ncbi:alpha/beta fold hydrolase [Actinomycetospora soli]|uniref:alpha/beta fold hydrolase n=1 Tax=Actinomycetospora soli TaxID=2893887 RepID=UPI001E425679|nr:alpha/beta hydrolase [Actinomycetospora soli]MCD2186535.1 alpha/beta hydrolase [Actinomycetospora soli]
MSRIVLVHGAGGGAASWSRVLPLLPDAVAVELPPDAVTWEECVEAVPTGEPAVLVGQSMGAFVVGLAASVVPTAGVVLLAPMVPAPGETAGAWWEATGHAAAASEAARAQGLDPAAVVPGPGFDVDVTFLHDVAPEVLPEPTDPSWPSAALFDAPYPLERWPDVPTRVLAARDDRLFPPAFVARLARARLGVEAEVVPGGHLAALSHPDAVAAALLA